MTTATAPLSRGTVTTPSQATGTSTTPPSLPPTPADRQAATPTMALRPREQAQVDTTRPGSGVARGCAKGDVGPLTTNETAGDLRICELALQGTAPCRRGRRQDIEPGT